MGHIEIFEETTKKPITLIGKRAGYCWGSDTTDDAKNFKRGLDCIKNNHGRTLEFPDVEMALDGYSARVIREWYTHIGCLPTRLQESTRYVDYETNLKYVEPKKVADSDEAHLIYENAIESLQKSMKALLALDIPREDVATLLPMSMCTRIVDKRNLRNLIDMSRQRMCSRAYWEYRDLFNDIIKALREYSDEWKYLIDELGVFHPKCDELGYCPESKGACGRHKRRV